MSTWDLSIRQWRGWLRAAGRPDTTIELRTYHLCRIARELSDVSPWKVTVDELAEWLGSHNWAPETRRSYRASLRSYYVWAQATGRRLDSPAVLLPTVQVPRGRPRPTPEIVYREAIARATPRETLMVRLAAQCGLRRGEIATVNREAVEAVLVGYALRVLGKGSHVRLVPLPDDLATLLLMEPAGWTFSSMYGGHLTPHHVGKLVSALMPDGWTCHTLRHRAATVAHRHTHNLRAVQELLGHAKPETTARYVEMPMDEIRTAMLAAAA